MAQDVWNVIDAERGVLWKEYQFRKKAWATTFVFRGPEGLIVVSPGRGLESADYDALEKHGEVRALVANNSYHHLGQQAWRARFPKAVSYASPGALARLAKKVPEVPFQSIEALAMPAGARWHALPGCNDGELVFTVPTAQGTVWFSGDMLTNMQRIPKPPLRWLFTLTDSGPGFRLFRPGIWLFVRDKQALRERLSALLIEEPPAMVVPAHGPLYTSPRLAEEARAQVAKL